MVNVMYGIIIGIIATIFATYGYRANRGSDEDIERARKELGEARDQLKRERELLESERRLLESAKQDNRKLTDILQELKDRQNN